MEGGDILDIPPRPNVVNVMGQVYNPTTLVHRPGSSDVDTYLSKAGGPTRDAEKSDMYIIRTDGSVFSRQQSSFGIKWSDESRTWNFGNFMSTEMDPGDTLVVPQKLEQTAWLRYQGHNHDYFADCPNSRHRLDRTKIGRDWYARAVNSGF
jgi:protein involved in polysaccharide export with SLBB domain